MVETPDDEGRGANHTVGDHGMGVDFSHIHDGWADHDHDTFGDEGDGSDALVLQDHVVLRSVGIDIGSSGTQLIFSRLEMRRLAEELSSRYYVVSRETLYQSPVALTPYQSETRIDERRLGEIVDAAYAGAGLHPDDIDTGVVILTGEALRRENAQAISGVIAEKGGEFVCATAGHHMESVLAAYGSGAARRSGEEKRRLLNIDIGGGTTKLAVVDEGKVVATAAVHVGGRLQVVDRDDRIVRLDPAGDGHAARAGFHWHVGDRASGEAMDRVADGMAETLVAAILSPHDALAHDFYLTDPLPSLEGVEGMIFSGGVGEYVYGRETRDFFDMGRRLGLALRARIDAGALPWPLLEADACIRATALGASEYSVQLSGNTTYVSDPGRLLPQRNLQVIMPPLTFGEVVDSEAVAGAITTHRAAFEVGGVEGQFALAFRWAGAPAYERLHGLALGIATAMRDRIAAGLSLFVALDGDIAQTLGAILREDLGVAIEVLVIDGVTLWDFDYIDLGRIRLPSRTIPVTIKSLVFSEDPRGPRPRQKLHHHGHHHHAHAHAHGEDGRGHDHHHHHDQADA